MLQRFVSCFLAHSTRIIMLYFNSMEVVTVRCHAKVYKLELPFTAVIASVDKLS